MIKKIVIIFEVVFISGVLYTLYFSVNNASKSVVKSNALSYLDAIEKQAVLNELSDSSDNISEGTFNIGDYEVDYGGKKPNSGVYKIVENEIEKALLYYKANGKSYYVCYVNTKVKITNKIDESSDCYDFLEKIK